MHIVAVPHLISQKGLKRQCSKLVKTLEKQAGTPADLHKSIGPTGSNSKEDQEAHKVETKQTTEMLEEARKKQDKATAKTYKLLRNLLPGDLQIQWDQICHKMHKRDSWAGVNSQVTVGRCLCLWIAIKDCPEQHKFTVFTTDAAKRQH